MELQDAVEIAERDHEGAGGGLAVELERHGDRGHAPDVVFELIGGDLDDREASTGALPQDVPEDAATVLVDDSELEADMA